MADPFKAFHKDPQANIAVTATISEAMTQLRTAVSDARGLGPDMQRAIAGQIEKLAQHVEDVVRMHKP